MLHKLNEPATDDPPPSDEPGAVHIRFVEYDDESQEEIEQNWRFECDQCHRIARVPSDRTIQAGMKPPKEGELWPEFPPMSNADGVGWITGVGGSVVSIITCHERDVIGPFADRLLDFCSFGCLADWAAAAEAYISPDQVPPPPD